MGAIGPRFNLYISTSDIYIMAEEGEVMEKTTGHTDKPLARPPRILPRCANLADLDILEKVGEGTFGYHYLLYI